jgi:hypothetical protein
LDGSEKRVAELEDTGQRFREEQGRIEEGILAALDRLDQFEDAINKGLSNVQKVVAAAAPVAPVYGGQIAPAPTVPNPAKAAPEAPVEDTLPDKEPSGEESVDEEPPPNPEETGSGEFDLF